MKRRAASASIVVAYIRCSTDEQHLGPDAQRAALTKWCAANGAQLVAVHQDLGVSGAVALDERPGLLAALEDVKLHGAGVLLVAKRDRLARDVMVAAMVERLVERDGCRILTADGTGNGEGPEALLMRGIVDVFAQYERALIRARTKAALAVKKTRNEFTGSAPYGFRLSADGVHLEADDVEARAVALAKQLRAEGGSLRTIGARLLAEGHAPRGGKSWNPNTVARIVAA